VRFRCIWRTYQLYCSHVCWNEHIYVSGTNSRIPIYRQKRCVELRNHPSRARWGNTPVWKVNPPFLTICLNCVSEGGVFGLLQQIVNEPPPKLPEGPDYQGLDLLIERCLVKDPEQRPRPEELMVFAYLKSKLIGRKILSSLLHRGNKSILPNGHRIL